MIYAGVGDILFHNKISLVHAGSGNSFNTELAAALSFPNQHTFLSGV